MQTSQYHIFSLPTEILDILTPRNLVNRPSAPPPQQLPDLPQQVSFQSGPRTCNICQSVSFTDVDQQRTHFRSDWHRYNVKLRLRGGQSVSEATFAQLIDALEDSLSGSASSSDEQESSESDAVNTLLKSKRTNSRPASPEAQSRNQPQTPLAWFHARPATQIGVYRALFSLHIKPETELQELRNMQAKTVERTWALFLVAAGHFAGALVRVSRYDEGDADKEEETKGKRRVQKHKPEMEVLKHKTFHRYTTRRKQGGSQSVNDNAKGNAKSAGAQLRRYGEQALRDDIRGLLQDWGEDIECCERIWLRASTSNRKNFVDFEGTPVSKGDERLRTFPFPTRRPTQSELMRCLYELTRPKISHLTEEALRIQDEEYLDSLPKPKTSLVSLEIKESPKAPIVKQPKLTADEELLREKWSRLLEMVSRGRLEPLRSFWDREASSIGGIDAEIPSWAGERCMSLLQLAAQAGHADVTEWLLEEAHADPTILVPVAEEEDTRARSDSSDSPRALPVGSRRVAYDLTRSKGVRDVFRRCAAAHPDWWDWFEKARVPSALSKEMEEERDEKKRVRRKGLKEKMREREAKREEEKPPSPPPEPQMKVATMNMSTANRLGGGSGSSDGLAGLSAEMRTKIERERRARAAEARRTK